MQGKSLAEHAAEPDVSIIAHIAAKRHALRSGLEDKVAIYLDTRFWIMVREVRDGTSKRADERAIVGLLQRIRKLPLSVAILVAIVSGYRKKKGASQ